MRHKRLRRTTFGRLCPLALYLLIVGGWIGEAVSIGAYHLIGLCAWTLPVILLYVVTAWRGTDGA